MFFSHIPPRHLLLVLATLCAACGPAPSPPAAALSIVAGGKGERANFHDLGTLSFGEEAEHVFSILNPGPESVRILNVRSACACSTPSLGYRDAAGHWVAGNTRNTQGPALVLPAGRTAELTLRVSTASVRTLNRDKLVLVRLQSDAPQTPFLTFELHLIVERLFQATPDPLDLGFTPRSGGGSARAELARAITDGAANILRLRSVTPPFSADLESWDNFGKPIWGLAASLPAGLDLGPVFGQAVLETTARDGTGSAGRFTLDLRAQVVTDWIASPARLLLRPAPGTPPGTPPGEAALEASSLVKFLLPGARQPAPRWEFDGPTAPALTVSLEPPAGAPAPGATPAPGAAWKLTLRAAPGALPRRASGTLRLSAAEENLPDLLLPWRAP